MTRGKDYVEMVTTHNSPYIPNSQHNPFCRGDSVIEVKLRRSKMYRKYLGAD